MQRATEGEERTSQRGGPQIVQLSRVWQPDCSAGLCEGVVLLTFVGTSRANTRRKKPVRLRFHPLLISSYQCLLRWSGHGVI